MICRIAYDSFVVIGQTHPVCNSSVFFSFDNSDYQRNGDYFPTRMNVQKDGINLVGMTKLRSNPENNIGLLTYAK